MQRLVGEWEVARMMSDVPHPYEDGMAEEWIAQPTAPRSRPENGLPSPWYCEKEEHSSAASHCT